MQAKFISMIIKQGMPVDIKDKKQLTAMHHAIHGNSLDAVKALYEAGADITMEDMEGRRYMEYASMYGSYNILVWFAKKFPELYINDETKETILHFAASQGLTEVTMTIDHASEFFMTHTVPGDRLPSQDKFLRH